MSAVYDLLESADQLYAGVRGEDMGWVYQSDLDGLSWAETAALPDSEVEAVRCLLEGPEGEILAGTERTLGPSATQVFVTRTEGTFWEPVGRGIDLANSVYDLFESSGIFYAATGHVYGNVYKTSEPWQAPERVYLPLVFKNSHGP